MSTPFLINHLWQSSCLALLMGLLAFVLRKNSPKVRYWVWLSASLKFLLPFALLVNLGSVIPRPARHLAPVSAPIFPSTFVQMAEPFSPTLQTTVPAHAPLDWAPVALSVLWVLGFLAIMLARCRSWLGVRAALRAGTPIELPIPIPALITPGAQEPGVVGFLRPVLVLPAQLLEQLNPCQLNAVLTHESCHVCRRDNFFAAVHMAVEAIFWFHPLVWWIGSHMLEERELACDEEVLRMGCEPADYVEAILKVCRFYTECPLPCISGVTGADVKKRLRGILAGSVANELSGTKKMALTIIGMAAFVAPIVIGALNAPAIRAQNSAAASQERLTFDVASVKPAVAPPGIDVTAGGPHGHRREDVEPFNSTGGPGTTDPGRIHYPLLSLTELLHRAYQTDYFEIKVPAWADTDAISVEATMPRGTTQGQFVQMLRNLIIDRFQLKTHVEKREISGYALVVAKNGPKLKESASASQQPDDGDPSPLPRPTIGPDGFAVKSPLPPGRAALIMHVAPGGGRMYAQQQTMHELAHALALQLAQEAGQPLLDEPRVSVMDATGLSRKYDFELTFAVAGRPNPGALPDIFSALQSQLGLKLEQRKTSVDILVVDHLEKVPSGN